MFVLFECYMFVLFECSVLDLGTFCFILLRQ